MIKEICIFAGGVVVGAIAAATLLSSKYRNQAEEEIAEMRSYYKNKEKNILEHKEYGDLVEDLGYIKAIDIPEDNKIEEKTIIKRPYIITEDEFAEGALDFEYHEQIDITYYAKDGVFVKWMEGRIDNPIDFFGSEAVELIKMDDTVEVYVRNDERREDYDIFKEEDSYEEVNDEEDVIEIVN